MFSTSVLIPASVVADSPDLLHRTFKVGLIGRALSIFRVNRVCVYLDDDPHLKNQERESRLVELLLRYMETPQYLRRIIFPKRGELRYAGMLPPLRTPHHPSQGEKNSPGSFRDGVVISSADRTSILEMGLPRRGVLRRSARPGQRITVRLGEAAGGGMIEVFPAEKEETGEYWGYEVLRAKGLKEGLELLGDGYRVGTSRYGGNLYEWIRGIKKEALRSVAIAFGGPYSGLREICRRQGLRLSEEFDAVVNTVPGQGVQTVRTEEALIVTLAIVNTLTGG
ncbi:MAG: putative RNA uridine N3 methyltransferase [Candidatus Hadarchaeales archaeon]